MYEIIQESDEVLIMKCGEVVDSGSRDSIFSPPFKPYTNLLFSSEPQMDPDWLDGHLAQQQAN